MADNKTFEQKMTELESIVNQLEQGNVPLEESMEKFKVGMKLSEDLQKTLTTAEKTMAKMVNKEGQEVPYEDNKNQTTSKGDQDEQ